MRKALPITEHEAAIAGARLNLDEKVWACHEFNRDVPGKGEHRIQRLFVRRGDLEVTFELDLGSSLQFPLAHEFRGWLGNEYSVGEAMEICAQHRGGQPEPEAPSDLMGNWLKQLDERRQWRQHRSVFGPAQFIQRD